MSITTSPSEFDQDRFRRVLGNFPTGVVVITAVAEDGTFGGMAVGSFTSVSLDPPLVAFLPARTSSSFPKIRGATSFCVNVLGSEQEQLCRRFAAKGGDKFAGVRWSPAPSGAPVLDGAVAWIDCIYEDVVEAGDHFIAIGRVTALDTQCNVKPLIFFQGGYGELESKSLVAVGSDDIVDQLRLTEHVRTEMKALAEELGLQCVAVGTTEKYLVLLGSAGDPAGESLPARIGYRIPLIAPVGALYVAWRSPADISAWLDSRGTQTLAGERESYAARLATVRKRGWSLALADDAHLRLEAAIGQQSIKSIGEDLDDQLRELTLALSDQYEPDPLEANRKYNVRLLSSPIFDCAGEVVLTLSLWGFPDPVTPVELSRYLDALQRVCSAVTGRLGGDTPRPPVEPE